MKTRSWFFLAALLMLLSSCSFERKVAMKYMKSEHNKGTILVVPPYSIDLFDNKPDTIDSTLFGVNMVLDSALLKKKVLLDSFSDSTFMEYYLNSFILNLQRLGYTTVLPAQLDSFYTALPPAYVIRFAQVELNEMYYPYEIDENIYGEKFQAVFPLSMVVLSNWLEFESRDTNWTKVFYAENAVMDELSAELSVNNFNGEPALIYALGMLSLTDIYKMGLGAGKKYAEYLNDFLMNSYIDKQLPAQTKKTRHFHYDWDGKILFPYSEGFEEIQKKE